MELTEFIISSLISTNGLTIEQLHELGSDTDFEQLKAALYQLLKDKTLTIIGDKYHCTNEF